MTAPSIVLVEDDAPLRTLTSRALREHGYHVRAAATGAEMWVLLENEPADLVVLDIMLPGTSGIDLLRRLRKTSEVPVIFVSARGSEEDRVGLELGADDYLAKPFGTRELIARIGAVLRRHGAPRMTRRSHGPARSASWAGRSRSPGANCARPRAQSSTSPARSSICLRLSSASRSA
jgi:DNA-binding response OmpR family regulator